MREILFRGKGKRTKKWWYGELISEKDKNGNKTFSIFTEKSDIYLHYTVHEESVGQYTGIDDKNGVKVFEGDIVKVHDLISGISDESRDFEGAVYYSNGSFFIENQYESHYRWMDYQLEVIGNRYDNPELLRMFAVNPRNQE